MTGRSAKIPPIFVSHGTPALAIDRAAGAELTQWAATLPRPRGVLVVSAHWQAPRLTRGSTAARPKLLYDADGYEVAPAELARVQYPAPGAPELAYEVAALLPIERSERGWDHGVWAPLVHLFPNADVPVLQLSLVAGAMPHAVGFPIRGFEHGTLSRRCVQLGRTPPR